MEVPGDSTVRETAAATTVNCMRSGGEVAFSLRFSPAVSGFPDEENMGFSMPPPPLPEMGSSWDYFYANDIIQRFDRNAEAENIESRQVNESRTSVENEKVGALRHEGEALGAAGCSSSSNATNGNGNGVEQSDAEGEKVEDLLLDREDPSEFITHRAKDCLCSIKDIENRFFRASEAGREVSMLLEASKIRVEYSEAKGRFNLILVDLI